MNIYMVINGDNLWASRCSGRGSRVSVYGGLTQAACRPFTQSSLQEIITPLRWREWDHSLWNHQDQRFRKYIVDGIRHGFRVGFNYEPALSVRSSSHNMVSASEHPEVIQGYLAEECSEGRVLGPLSPMQMPSVVMG